MSELTMAVKREYFKQIKAGTKKGEYRLVCDYWRRRLEGKSYKTITITLGYPPKTNTERRISFPYRGYELQTIQHKEFGNHPVAVYALILEGEKRGK